MTDVAQSVEDVQAPVLEDQDQAQSTEPSEKMIPQSQVSKIAAREAREAAEKAASKTRNEMLAEFERQKSSQSTANTPPTTNGFGGISPEDLEQKIFEVAHKMSTQAMAQKIESDFNSKMEAEKAADPEFKDLYDALNIENHPELVLWTNSMDNTAKVMKDLAKNPGKFANILMLKSSGSPKLAQLELAKLSSSIKANEDAQNVQQPDEPLSQLKPTINAKDSGDNMSVADYMKIFRG